ncbi:50S ribosomal protein L9 [bacterium]|nr:MAG: 50S ribosomal protein L9 [bacterium]
MKIVLKQDVEKVGKRGEVVAVKDGYGRNYLIPAGLAVVATEGAVKDAKERKRLVALKQDLSEAAAVELAEKIEATSLTISVKTGDEGKLHGTVTTQQIVAALAEKDIIVDRKVVSLGADINALGEYTATVALSSKVKAKLKVWVVKA